MLKIITFTALMIVSLVTSAQRHYIIAGNSKGFNNGDRIFLSYKEHGKNHNDSTIVKDGVFKFSGNIDSLGVGYLSRNDNPLFAEFLFDTCPVYLQQGEIQITTPDSLLNAAVTGTSLNNDQTELRSALSGLSKKLNAVTRKSDALTPEQQSDTRFTDAFRITTDSLLKLMEPIKFAFLKAHPGSYVSLLTLERLVNEADLPLVETAYNSLSFQNKSTLLGQTIGASIRSAKHSQIGAVAADFTLSTSSGVKIKLSDYKGRYVLIDFWASWCLPCRQENPNVVAAYNSYKDKRFSVISISRDNDEKAWLEAIKKDGLPWIQTIDNKQIANSVAEFYGVTTIPANILIAPSGKIVAKNIKGSDLHNTLQKFLKE